MVVSALRGLGWFERIPWLATWVKFFRASGTGTGGKMPCLYVRRDA
jgi:hypothetical protein